MHQIKLKLLPLALLALIPNSFAQQIPGAGTQLTQLLHPATPQQTEPRIQIEEATSPAAAGAASVSVVVSDLQFTGAHVYPATELLDIARFTPGSNLTLQDLQGMAARITEHYRSHGYFVARAYIPA